MIIYNNDIIKVNIIMDVRNDFMKIVFFGKVFFVCNVNVM